ncbi:MAG: polysaccharide pyruvyl transferase CsaB [Vulcanibacillus sp.]
MRKGVTILGYYGANNTGDEAILFSMVSTLRNQGINDITVLSRNPEQTKLLHNVNSIYTGRRFNGLIEIYKLLRESQLFILGGGGLLQDHSGRVIPYWLSRVIIAFMARTPVIYYANGVGPISSNKARWLVRIISNRVSWITVRDEPSLQLLKEIGVNRPKMEVTADPAIAIDITSDGKRLLEQAGVNFTNDRLRIAICLRNWTEEGYFTVFLNSLKMLREKYNIQFIFLPFQFGQDEPISEYALKIFRDDNSLMINGSYTPEQMAAMLKEMDGIIAMRLHALILGSISFRPLFGLIYDPKVENFMERLGLTNYTYNIKRINNQREQFEQVLINWINNREEISNQIKQPVQEMRKQAERNVEIVKDLLKSGR